MSYRLSGAAEADLLAIYAEGVREYGLAQADAYFAGIENIFEFLTAYPRAARERIEIRPPVRVFRYKAHLVIYRLVADDVLILRLRHGREDWINDMPSV